MTQSLEGCWEFTGRIKEIDGNLVIEIPETNYPRARALEGQQIRVVVES